MTGGVLATGGIGWFCNGGLAAAGALLLSAGSVLLDMGQVNTDLLLLPLVLSTFCPVLAALWALLLLGSFGCSCLLSS